MKNILLTACLMLGFISMAQKVKKPTEFDKEYHKAIAKFNKKNDSVSYEFYYRRGSLSCDYGRYYEAIKDYDKAVEMAPENAIYYYDRAVAKMEAKLLDDAIADYTKAIALDNNMTGAYNNRGICYFFKDNYAQAIEDYNRAIELDPKSGLPYTNRGLAKIKSGLTDAGCNDLYVAQALGDKKSTKAIKKYCQKQ